MKRVLMMFGHGIFFMLVLCLLLQPRLVQGQTSTLSQAAESLLRQVQVSGTVRVIVGIRAPDAPAGMDDNPSMERAWRRLVSGGREALISAADAAGHVDVHPASRDWTIPYVALTVDEAAYRALLAHPGVMSIEEDTAEPLLLTQTTGIINADPMWSLGFTGAGYAVAVLDSGVNAAHTAFGGRVVAEACFSSNQPNVSASLCPNEQPTQIGAGAASPARCLALFGAGVGCEHGTHVASIAAGQDATIKGVATGAYVIAVQVFSDIFDFGTPRSYISDQVSALNHVYSLRQTWRITAVNLSLGGGFYTATCDAQQSSRAAAFALLRDAGIVPIVAAGNNGYIDAIGAPACISTAVSVGATTDTDQRASFSNSLPSLLTLFAPGVSVYAAYPGGYGSMSGTSQAAPHVAGAFAMLNQAIPNLNPAALISYLRSTGLPIVVPGGSTPRIDILSAYNTMIASTPGVIVRAPLQSRPTPSSRAAVPLSVRITRLSDGAVLLNTTRSTDFNGRFTEVIASDTYRVRVKHALALAVQADVTVGGGLTPLNLPTLPVGDANNDNVIDIRDFSVLATAFGMREGDAGYDVRADFNADGVVNLVDFSLMAVNFGMAGAP